LPILAPAREAQRLFPSSRRFGPSSLFLSFSFFSFLQAGRDRTGFTGHNESRIPLRSKCRPIPPFIFFFLLFFSRPRKPRKQIADAAGVIPISRCGASSSLFPFLFFLFFFFPFPEPFGIVVIDHRAKEQPERIRAGTMSAGSFSSPPPLFLFFGGKRRRYAGRCCRFSFRYTLHDPFPFLSFSFSLFFLFSPPLLVKGLSCRNRKNSPAAAPFFFFPPPLFPFPSRPIASTRLRESSIRRGTFFPFSFSPLPSPRQ